jgi:uncharacterized repeat protein (TIGR03843 family)
VRNDLPSSSDANGRDDSQSSVDAEGSRDAKISVHEGSVHEGSVHEGSVHEGSVHEGSVHEGSVPEGSVPEGSVNADVLMIGEMEIEGRMPWSSNATFLVILRHGEDSIRGIYKPHRGERPLWDFPSGLYQREVATYELAAFLGWNVIPRTVKRDGDFGIGSIQTFIDADFSQQYFTILESMPDTHDQLRMLATLDILANNADRKGGHVLIDGSLQIWGIDNGLCFHEEPNKLRTVMWDFAGDVIPKPLRTDIERLVSTDRNSLGPLNELLDESEITSVLQRAKRLLKKPTFPNPSSNYAYPWPLV